MARPEQSVEPLSWTDRLNQNLLYIRGNLSLAKAYDWIGLVWNGSAWVRLDRIGSDWIILDQIGIDWIRLD